MVLKQVNLIRHLFSNYPFSLCVQFPISSTENMTEVAKPLIDELEGKPGLFYTAWFKWSDVQRVKEFFQGLGYTIHYVDEREKDKELALLLGERHQ